ncbi:MAG: MBL fold metallo-hydrolase [Acidimicrobiaceae bacterium]|nr:MBL fold metallo-hydrolase [Acidimicrobiia bacterium]MCY4493171.1 MBL fold metallo-hydrolase [Acidimicrobiaceae bacterium]
MPATVVVVDVGQGDCTIAVDHGTKQALLIDCNEHHHLKALAALKKLGYSELTAVVVTHSHIDHFGGVLDVLGHLPGGFTGRLHFNHDTLLAMPRSSDESEDNKSKVRALLRRTLEYSDQVVRAQSDIGPQTLGSMSWRLLAPSYSQLNRAVALGNPNLASGIVIVESEDKTVVVGGDAPLETWEQVKGDLPTRSIVRWPHHGGSISTSDTGQATLLELLDPEAVLVSVGANNIHNLPSDEFFTAVAAHGSRLLCTQATTKCTGTTGSRCAGSIQIDLTSTNKAKPIPARADHDTFVQNLNAARCL